jgi:hypothetical protein
VSAKKAQNVELSDCVLEGELPLDPNLQSVREVAPVTVAMLQDLTKHPQELVGDIGELHCAQETGGTLAPKVNQHGWDVMAPDGARISVKMQTWLTPKSRQKRRKIKGSTITLVDRIIIYRILEDLSIIKLADVTKDELLATTPLGKNGYFDMRLS